MLVQVQDRSFAIRLSNDLLHRRNSYVKCGLMIQCENRPERMRFTTDTEYFPLGVLRPNHMCSIHGNQFARQSRIVRVGPIPQFRRALATGSPINHRQCHVDILRLHRNFQPIHSRMHMGISAIPPSRCHIDPTLQSYIEPGRFIPHPYSLRPRIIFFPTLDAHGVFAGW